MGCGTGGVNAERPPWAWFLFFVWSGELAVLCNQQLRYRTLPVRYTYQQYVSPGLMVCYNVSVQVKCLNLESKMFRSQMILYTKYKTHML